MLNTKLPGLRALSLAVLVAGAAGAAAAQPVADFFRPPEFGEIKVSPDGRKVAAVMYRNGARGELVVFELSDPRKAKGLVAFDKLDVAHVHWVNNERLVYSARDTRRLLLQAIAPGLWAIDADGDNVRQLVQPDGDGGEVLGTNIRSRALSWNWTFDDVLGETSNDVMVRRHVFDNGGQLSHTSIARLDTRTGTLKTFLKDVPPSIVNWWTDVNGRPVAAVGASKAEEAFYLHKPDGSWEKTFETRAWTDSVPRPLAVDARGELWMVGADPEGKGDTSVLMRYEIAKPGAKPRVVLSFKGYDFQGSLVSERASGEVLGVRFETDGPDTHWFHPRMKAIQAEIDAKLEGTVNAIVCARCVDAEALLVLAYSDRQPTVMLRYEPGTKKLTQIGNSRPWIKPEQMGAREPQTIKTRDGLAMPVMLTHPPGPRKAGRPAVVLVHGGPYVRGTHWAWNGTAQLLASRGYVVIEPEFRGSAGYGHAHFEAGFKQWGLKMQDDIADAGDWAAQQGIVDPKRVCIAGASYGGYAALMGLARYGDRYQCAISWAAVSDLDLMFTSTWSDLSDAYKTHGMPALIGDRSKDAQRLRDTSPVHLAASIRKPLLLAHGGADQRVPVHHGLKMRDALKDAGHPALEWVLYGEEGHGWARIESDQDFWTRAEKLLARSIGEPAGR